MSTRILNGHFGQGRMPLNVKTLGHNLRLLTLYCEKQDAVIKSLKDSHERLESEFRGFRERVEKGFE